MTEAVASEASAAGRLRAIVGPGVERLRAVHAAAACVAAMTLAWVVLFGRLAVQNHRNFGTWSYDMGIYDQGFWLVSQGGNTFMTVRGLDFWGHHLNLIAFAFAPFYWLGAGPSFLYAVQAILLGFGAVPTYLIARDRFQRPWIGLLFAFVYLMYAPVQWISWAMFHPEALVISPMLFAWWFATRQQWGWFFGAVLLALSMREEIALAVVMMGFVLLVYLRGRPGYDRARRMALAAVALGLAWYAIAVTLVLPHFNHGRSPFYIEYFYGSYGKSLPEVGFAILRHPDRVVNDAIQPDRLRFYRDLILPWGGLPLAGPLTLTMALPQMLASVIGASPYARMIRYQYTAVMIAPIVISAIEGAWRLWRFRATRIALPVWMVLCAYVTNVAWSPSPIGNFYESVWAKPSLRRDTMRAALTHVPVAAAVSATYSLLPHLAHRREIYDWPNPFVPNVWGNRNCDHLPDPATIDYLAVDRTQVGAAERPLVDDMLAAGGPFELVFDRDNVLVARRVGTDVKIDVHPQRRTCPAGEPP
jgi:uncharacterized membrane protein